MQSAEGILTIQEYSTFLDRVSQHSSADILGAVLYTVDIQQHPSPLLSRPSSTLPGCDDDQNHHHPKPTTSCEARFFPVENFKAMVLNWKGTSESPLKFEPHDTDSESVDLEQPRLLYQNLQDVGLKNICFQKTSEPLFNDQLKIIMPRSTFNINFLILLNWNEWNLVIFH